jgi:hypothetical protein
MRTIFGSRRHHHLVRSSVFLVAVALITGMVSCDGVVQYSLTVSSTVGGNVTAPGIGNFTYGEGTVVNLVAEAEEGYYFIKWSGDVNTTSDANAIETTITMNGHCFITANFAPDGVEPLWTWYDLAAIEDNLAGNYALMNDLDSTTAGYEELAGPTADGGKGWQPIGSWDAPFTGTFDGQGYEIRDLFINRSDEKRIGLFGMIYIGGFVKNLGVVDVTVTGDRPVGGLAGFNWATISNCYSTGSVTGNKDVGGLVGANLGGAIRNCYSVATVIGKWYVGGLVGANQGGAVSDSHSGGNITGRSSVGGLIGTNVDPGTESSYPSSSVTDRNSIGILIEFDEMGTVSNSYSTASVAGDEDVGGLVGSNWCIVRNSYCTGRVNGNRYVGGLVGYTQRGIVSNSHYDYNEVLINGDRVITTGALFSGDFEEWLANDKFLDVNDRLSQEGDYYLINHAGDFKQLLAFGQDASLKFRLKNDIDLAGEPDLYIPYLAGEFDGNAHRISNFSFNFNSVYQVGLFGHLAYGGRMHDVAAEDVDVTAFGDVGGLVGVSFGHVSNSYSTGRVTGDDNVGGLVGYSWSRVLNSYSTATVTGSINVGGLVGEIDSLVSDSYSCGNVTGISNVGGLVGDSLAGTVKNCYSTGMVNGEEYVGGLAGIANEYYYIRNSFWDTETSGQATSDGGTGKNTTEMQDIATFTDTQTEGLDEPWDMITVADPSTRNPAYIWNIVDDETYPFLSWQP